jgi:hypothetical protein
MHDHAALVDWQDKVKLKYSETNLTQRHFGYHEPN